VTSPQLVETRDPWQRAADAARRIGRRVEYHATIGSTNDRAREALAAGEGDGLAVVADLQTGGRGRRGRVWLSPAGRNLMVSAACRPRLSQAAAGWLGAAVAIAVRDACQAMVPGRLAVRWPNDIVDAAGAKLAGVLVETVIEGGHLTEAILGVGINVNWPSAQMPPEIASRSTSLADLGGRDLDRIDLLGSVLDRLDAEMASLEDNLSPIPRLREVLALRGEHVVVEQGDGRVSGVVIGLDDDGALLVDTPAGRRAMTAGEVVRLGPVGEATA